MEKHKNLRSTLLVIVISVLTACSSSPSKNNEITTNKIQDHSKVNKVYFAGFALSGDNQSSKINFPYTFSLMNEKVDRGMSKLDIDAQNAIKLIKNPNLQIITSELGDYKKDQGISAAVVIDSEDVSQEVIGGHVKIVVTLRGQIVAFNFKEMKVIGSYPLTAELIDAKDRKLSEQEVASSVKQLYGSFIRELVDRFNKISINTDYTRGIQIKNIVIPNDIAKSIQKSNQSTKDIQTFVARNFEKYLSINQNVAILPFTKDQSVGGRLSARFSNGEIYNLEIPSPDYTISLELKKMKSVPVTSNSVEDVYGYLNIMNIKAEQPEMKKTYLDFDVRYVLPVTIPKSMTDHDDRAHYLESIIQLVNTFSKQVTLQDSDWLDTWVETGKKEPKDEQIVQFLDVINKCK